MDGPMFVDGPSVRRAMEKVRQAQQAADRALTGVQNDLRDAGAAAGSQVRQELLQCANAWVTESVELQRRMTGVADNLQQVLDRYHKVEEDVGNMFDSIGDSFPDAGKGP